MVIIIIIGIIIIIMWGNTRKINYTTAQKIKVMQPHINITVRFFRVKISENHISRIFLSRGGGFSVLREYRRFRRH